MNNFSPCFLFLVSSTVIEMLSEVVAQHEVSGALLRQPVL